MVGARLGRRGFALVAVLWVLALVGAAAAALLAGARAEARAAANAQAATRARWAARAGLARALDTLDRSLARSGIGMGLAGSGEAVLPPVEFELERVAVRVSLLDSRAHLQVNLAEEAPLRRLIAAAGAEGLEPSGVAAAIRSRRPFQSVDDLRALPGMTSGLYSRLAPYVTVIGDGRVNVNAASLPVLLTLPGIDSAAAATIIARRRSALFRNGFELLRVLPGPARRRIEAQIGKFLDAAAFGPRDVEIVVTAAPLGTGPTAGLRAAVHLPGGAMWRVDEVVER